MQKTNTQNAMAQLDRLIRSLTPGETRSNMRAEFERLIVALSSDDSDSRRWPNIELRRGVELDAIGGQE